VTDFAIYAILKCGFLFAAAGYFAAGITAIVARFAASRKN